MEELFIEVVDTELCYQLNQRGYQIKFFPNISLIHQVGDVHKEFRIFGKKIMSLNTHSPIRYYYVYRNLKYLSDKGYTVKKIVPVDMFPRTSHCETVALLTQR